MRAQAAAARRGRGRSSLAAVERALDDGVTPVVLAPALGAAEDVVALLAAAALPLRVHARIAAWVDAYARIGVAA